MSDRPPIPQDEDFDLGEIEGGEDASILDENADDALLDEGGEEAGVEGEGEDEEVTPAASPQQRAGRKTQAQRWRERTERSERELAELRQQVAGITQARQQPAYDPAAAARAEQAELEQVRLMAPDEVARHYYQKAQREMGAVLAQQQFAIEDRIDRQAYENAAARSALHQRYAPRVEALLQSERASGRNTSREVILKYLVGEDAMQRATRAAPTQQRQAARRVAGAQARPTGSRSDAGSDRRPAPDSYEASLERLRGKPIW